MSTEIVAPVELVDVQTGEALPATVGNAARVLRVAREMKERLNAVVRDATDYLVAESTRLGTKTLRAGDAEVVLSGGTTVDYDLDRLRSGLIAAGCPDARIDEAIVATVTYKVNRAVLRSIGSANETYRRVIEDSQVPGLAPYRASVR